MKLVFASDSFKGSLSSKRIAELLDTVAEKKIPGCEAVSLYTADGGEGTCDAVLEAVNGRRVPVAAHGPLMEPIETYYGVIDRDTVIIEAAMTSGLTLVPFERRDPLITSTYGSGEAVRKVLLDGYKNVIIGIGGTATNDGGTGFLKALGVRFLNEGGNEIRGIGCELEKIRTIDASGLIPEVKDAHFTVMCDVTNPLCGVSGATYTYGRQKGGTDESLDRLEKGMRNYRDVIRRQFNIDPDTISGGGAAGGLGTALKVFLKATMRSGIDTLLDIVHFDEIIKDADLIVTGEGRLDGQSMNGKVVFGIGERAGKMGIPIYALCGCLGDGCEEILKHGITKVFETREEGMSTDEAMQRAEELYIKAAEKMLEHFLTEHIR